MGALINNTRAYITTVHCLSSSSLCLWRRTRCSPVTVRSGHFGLFTWHIYIWVEWVLTTQNERLRSEQTQGEEPFLPSHAPFVLPSSLQSGGFLHTKTVCVDGTLVCATVCFGSGARRWREEQRLLASSQLALGWEGFERKCWQTHQQITLVD